MSTTCPADGRPCDKIPCPHQCLSMNNDAMTELDKAQLKALQYKQWWDAERERARALENSLNALRHQYAELEEKLDDALGWQPITTAQQGAGLGPIDIWVEGHGLAPHRLANCRFDWNSGQWRVDMPGGHTVFVPEQFITHWRPVPSAPE